MRAIPKLQGPGRWIGEGSPWKATLSQCVCVCVCVSVCMLSLCLTPERPLTHCPLTLLVSWLDDVPEASIPTLGFLFLFNICSPGIELKHRDEDGTVVESAHLRAVWCANTHHRGGHRCLSPGGVDLRRHERLTALCQQECLIFSWEFGVSALGRSPKVYKWVNVDSPHVRSCNPSPLIRLKSLVEHGAVDAFHRQAKCMCVYTHTYRECYYSGNREKCRWKPWIYSLT